jgi:hypothetical protein
MSSCCIEQISRIDAHQKHHAVLPKGTVLCDTSRHQTAENAEPRNILMHMSCINQWAHPGRLHMPMTAHLQFWFNTTAGSGIGQANRPLQHTMQLNYNNSGWLSRVVLKMCQHVVLPTSELQVPMALSKHGPHTDSLLLAMPAAYVLHYAELSCSCE